MSDQRKQCILERCFICLAYDLIFSLSNIATKFPLFPLWNNSNKKKSQQTCVRQYKELKVVQDLFMNIVNIFQSTHNLKYVYLHYTSTITAISKTLKTLSIGKTFFKRFLNPNIPSLFFNISF